jgi:hypothetical protein
VHLRLDPAQHHRPDEFGNDLLKFGNNPANDLCTERWRWVGLPHGRTRGGTEPALESSMQNGREALQT